jgi:tetratricopeptide (TPR) repeat protein
MRGCLILTENEKLEDLGFWKKNADKFFEDGKYLDALEAYENMARMDPKNTLAWKGMATAFSLLDKPYEALESLNKALNIDPTDLEALEIKGLILKKLLEDNEEELNRLKTSKSG